MNRKPIIGVIGAGEARPAGGAAAGGGREG